jgi:hypothetical protein
MAVTSVRAIGELEGAFVLAPERYDPRRESLGAGATVPLRALAYSVRQTVSVETGDDAPCVVLDTGNAQEGVVVSRKPPVPLSEVGSSKKAPLPGDVIVSRLRPYLRQVAFVDGGVRHLGEGVRLLCSTEFFVLRSADGRPIAFLAPFLLSGGVQAVLAAAQEGGHHPRFNEATLLGLPVPRSLVDRREELSAEVERAVRLFRQSEQAMANLIEGADPSVRTGGRRLKTAAGAG